MGIVADLKLQEYINLRFEPGLYYTKETWTFLDSVQKEMLYEK
jgi:hypothetical protein